MTNQRPGLLLLGALMVVAGIPDLAHAQARDGEPAYWVVGQMVDRGSGLPVRRGEICIAPPATRRWSGSCAESDTAGRFKIEAEDSGSVRLFFGCSPARGRFLVEMGSSVVTPLLDSGAVGAVHRVGARRCDQRPFEVVTKEWSGSYVYGFEAGSFFPCGDTVAAWVDFESVPGLRSHQVPIGPHGVSAAFVRWIGTRVGPGSYGHMGVEPYRMAIDSLLEVRPPSKEDCGRVSVDSIVWRRAMVQGIVAYLQRHVSGDVAVLASEGSDSTKDPWTEALIAELGNAIHSSRTATGGTTRVRFEYARPLSFPPGPVHPLVALQFWVDPPDACGGIVGGGVFRDGTVAQLVEVGGRLKVRFAEGGFDVIACGGGE